MSSLPRQAFYGQPIPEAVASAIDEGLTANDETDLVAAHLAHNRAYFGIIDKTLSGFVVIGDQDDDYLLADVRGGGQIWQQYHEDRSITPVFDSIEEMQRARAAVREAREEDEDADENAILEGFAPRKPRHGDRIVSTSKLLERYQWLVWALSQPLDVHGQSVADIIRLINDANARYPFDGDQAAKRFSRERKHLPDDPHLAIYWCLHARLWDETEWLEQLRDTLADVGVPLVQAFLNSDLEMVADIEARRALLRHIRALGTEGVESHRHNLRALELHSSHHWFGKTFPVATALVEGHLDAELVESTLAKCSPSTGVDFLRGALDRLRSTPSPAADRALTALLGRPGVQAFEAAWLLHPVASDLTTLTTIASRSLAEDPYHPRVLELCKAIRLRAPEAFGDEGDLDARIAVAKAAIEPLRALSEGADPDSLDVPPEVAEVLSRRLCFRPAWGSPRAITWAVETVLASGADDRFRVVRSTFDAMEAKTLGTLLPALTTTIDSADHPMADVLMTVLEGIEQPESLPFGQKWELQKKVEALVLALAPYAPDAPLFDRWMRLVEARASSIVTETLIKKYFDYGREEYAVMHRIDDAQAARIARALIALHRHPDIHVRNAAGHKLYRVKHPGATEVVIEAMKRVTAALAVERTEPDENLSANLYSVLLNLKSAASRAALVEQLFTERREFWRLCNALATAQKSVRNTARKRLLKSKDAHAAAVWMAGLVQHVKNAEMQLDLTRAVVTWPLPDDVEARSWLVYVLQQGVRAALEAKDNDLVRAAWERSLELNAAPVSPYHQDTLRWKPPFDGEGEAHHLALEAVLSGEADDAAKAVRDRAAADRRAGKPRKRITDEDLSLLAGATITERWSRDKKTGEMLLRDSTGAFHWFDGFDVVEPPFDITPEITRGSGAFFEGLTEVSERHVLWTKSAGHFEEWVRYEDRIVSGRGVNNGYFAGRMGMRFPSTVKAAAFMASVKANPTKGYTASEPWYVAGRGGIYRTWYRGSKRLLAGAMGHRVDGQQFDSWEETVAWLDAYDLETWKQGGTVTRVEWMDPRRKEDTTLQEHFSSLLHEAGTHPVRQLEALSAMIDYLTAHGIEVPDVSLELGEPATDTAIEAALSGLPDEATTGIAMLWRQHGSVVARAGARSTEVLSPDVALARRLEDGSLPLIEQDGQVFSALDGGGIPVRRPGETTSGWGAMQFLSPVVHAFRKSLVDARPEIAGMWFGQPHNPTAEHVAMARDGATWEAWLDRRFRVFSHCTTRKNGEPTWTVKRFPTESAAVKAFERARKSREKKGWSALDA